MKFSQYLNDSINPSKIKKVKKILGKKYNLNPSNIEYLNVTEEPLIKKRIYWFNILDKNHPKFKSTIAYNERI